MMKENFYQRNVPFTENYDGEQSPVAEEEGFGLINHRDIAIDT